MTRIGSLAAVLVVAAAVLPIAAAAQTGKIVTEWFASSPVLVGDRALWMQSGDQGPELWSGAPGRRPVRVQLVSRGGLSTSRLAASSSLALVTIFGYADRWPGGLEPDHVDHFLGPPSGPLERITHCTSREGALRSGDVWGEAYAYRQCDDADGHVEIRDTGTPALSPARSVGVGGYGVRIAGRFVAWLEQTYDYDRYGGRAEAVVVYDRVADREVYRLTPEDVPGVVHAIDLQEDGKLALAFDVPGRGGRAQTVGWASPAEPRIHRVKMPRPGEYDVRIAGDRVAFHGGWTRSFTIQHSYLGVADLAGNVKIVARNTTAFVWHERFDFDGERVAWTEVGCKQRRIVVRDVSRGGIAPGSAKVCPLRLKRRPSVRGGVATFHFGCGAFRPKCLFDTTLALPGRGRASAGDGVDENPVRIRLTKAARRILKREGSLRVNARLFVTDNAGVEHVRRGKIRLRR